MGTKKKHRIGHWILGILLLLIAVWWIVMTPDKDIRISGIYELGENEEVLAMEDPSEPLASQIVTVCDNMPGYDEFLPLPDGRHALTTCMDGWIWMVDLENWTAEQFIDAPLEAAGAVMDPLDENRVYFCSSYLYGETYPQDETPGIYALDMTTKQVTAIVNRTPLYEYSYPAEAGDVGFVYADGSHSMRVPEMNEDNSMICAFCNDLAISRDGKRIYWSEPFNYEGAAMGGGKNVYETISLGQHGRIWCYDLDADTVSLVGDGFSFADGLLLEYADEEDAEEDSILVCETIKYCISRLYLSGSRSGTAEVVWNNLPGMCDGMGYDENGNIWVGLLHARSGIVDLIYKHPWMKHIFLRVPADMISGSKGCGLIAFDPTASKVLYYTMYTGENISDIPVAVGFDGKIFLPSFVKDQRGLHYIPNPLQ